MVLDGYVKWCVPSKNFRNFINFKINHFINKFKWTNRCEFFGRILHNFVASITTIKPSVRWNLTNFDNNSRKNLSKSPLGKKSRTIFSYQHFCFDFKVWVNSFPVVVMQKMFAVSWPLKCCVIRGQTRSTTLSATSKFELNSFQHNLYTMTIIAPIQYQFKL